MNTEHKEKHLKPGMTYRFRYRNRKLVAMLLVVIKHMGIGRT